MAATSSYSKAGVTRASSARSTAAATVRSRSSASAASRPRPATPERRRRSSASASSGRASARSRRSNRHAVAGAHRRDGERQQRGVGLGVFQRGHAHRGLRERVVRPQPAAVDRPPGEQRAERDLPRSGLRPDQPPASVVIASAATARAMGVERSLTRAVIAWPSAFACWPRGSAIGCDALSAGSLMTTRARTGASSRRPPGRDGARRSSPRPRARSGRRDPAGSVGGGERLGHVDDAPAAQCHEPAARHVDRISAATMSTSPAGTWRTAAAAPPRRAAGRQPAPWSGACSRPRAGRGRRRGSGAEDDGLVAVAVAERVTHRAARFPAAGRASTGPSALDPPTATAGTRDETLDRVGEVLRHDVVVAALGAEEVRFEHHVGVRVADRRLEAVGRELDRAARAGRGSRSSP